MEIKLKQSLKNCSKNASYISKTSQNYFTNCCGQFITEFVVRNIKQNIFFPTLKDEPSDCSNQEHLSLDMRDVDSDCVKREEFLEERFLFRLWGKALADTGLGGLMNLGLSIRNCYGPGYD